MVHIKPEKRSRHGAQCAGKCKVDAYAVNLLGHSKSRKKQGLVRLRLPPVVSL